MSTLTQAEFHTLITERSAPSLSLYMPTRSSGGRDTQQEVIRLKNLVREAEDRLSKFGLRSREVEAFLKPLEPLFIDTPFWSYQSDGLAIFLSPDTYKVYRLPQNFREEVTISDRFRLKPLIGLLNYQTRFALLALSLNGIRLLECSIYGVREFDHTEYPVSLAEWSKNFDRETHLQARSTASRGGGQRGSMVHGHTGTGEEKQELQAFLREVERETSRLLANSEMHLMLAGVDNVTSVYREISGYSKLLKPTLSGSPERIHSNDLHRKAWELFVPQLDQERERIVARYQERKSAGLASDTWEDIVPAIVQGRVESLLIGEGVERPGHFNEETLQVELAPAGTEGAEDMAEFAALTAYANGTAVHVVPKSSLPDKFELIAVYRY